MSHRRIAFHRVFLNTSSEEIFPAETQAIIDIPDMEIASDSKQGSALNYRRSAKRYFKMAPQAYQDSSVVLALGRINMVLSSGPHYPQDNLVIDHPVTVNDQALMRTIREPGMNASYGPTPEGVHKDNTEISGVTLVGRRDVASGAESRLWSNEMANGNYNEDCCLSCCTPSQHSTKSLLKTLYTFGRPY